MDREDLRRQFRDMGLPEAEIEEKLRVLADITGADAEAAAPPPLGEMEMRLGADLVRRRKGLLRAHLILAAVNLAAAALVGLAGYLLDGYLIYFLMIPAGLLTIAGTMAYHAASWPYRLQVALHIAASFVLIFFTETMLHVGHRHGFAVAGRVLAKASHLVAWDALIAVYSQPKPCAIAIICIVIGFFACRPSIDEGDIRRALAGDRPAAGDGAV